MASLGAQQEAAKVSAAFFCPQTKSPDEAYLVSLHAFLNTNVHGRVLLQKVIALAEDQLWETFASARNDVQQLHHGPHSLELLKDWALNGVSGPLSQRLSNISSLPLLVVMQAGQYLRYLEICGKSHQEFLSEIQNAGGVHGYCGGMPTAIAVASSENETEFVQCVATALRITVGIAAYTEAADDEMGTEQTLLAVRLKYEGQGDDLIRNFPDAYISAITGPRAVSFGGPAATVRKLYQFITESEGLRAEKIDLGGSAHNPKNFDLATELCHLCQGTPGLQLPGAERLLVPMRSNRTGGLLRHGSLTDELIYTMLSARCEWYSLLTNVAQDLKQSPRAEHDFAIFGWSDCVTMTPFHQARLKITKTFAKAFIQAATPAPPSHNHGSAYPNLPENSVAIIGAACRLPGASDMAELWGLVSKGESRAREVSTARCDLSASFRASQSGSQMQERTYYGNFIDDAEAFDHAFFSVSAREAANMDPQQRIMLELSFEALEDAGYLASHDRTAFDNVGCFVGLVLAEYMDNTNCHGSTAYTSSGTVPAFVCGRVSHTYGWSGPSEMFNTACSSSMVAINRACKAVQSGECRMALAGGVNVITGINNYLDLAKAGFLSPTGQCKPFDASADGYCRADGAGLVVLKSLRDARKDGDTIWGVIPAVATNQGGLSSTLTTPSPVAQQMLYQAVLRQAGLSKDDISYVEAHGTGTQVGDPLEMESIRSVFGSSSRQHGLHIGSLKANIGHCEPTAGVAGLLKVLTMLRHRQIPPQANFRCLNPKIPSLDRDGLSISRNLIPWADSFHAALVNSYGAAGSNAALVVCDAPASSVPQGERDLATRVSYALAISASSTTSLLANAMHLGAYLAQNIDNANMRIADLSFTLNQKRQRQRYFAFVTAKTTDEAAQHLKLLTSRDIHELPLATSASKSIVLTFSGQTSQTVGLPKSLYDSFPIFKSYIDACDAEIRKLMNVSLLPAIFQDGAIENIALLQCGMFTVQYACARCWLDAGLQPAAVVGHSLGELTALVVSGVLSFTDGIRLIAARGGLIQNGWGSEKGSMLHLECTVDDFAALTALERDDSSASAEVDATLGELEIACFNGPTSLVVSGPERRIARLQKILQTKTDLRTIRCTRLSTSHAFHSALTEPILSGLVDVGRLLTWNKPCIPIYACSETDKASFDGEYVAAHARDAVFFHSTINRIEKELGPCVWLEAGLNSSITSMVKRACRQPQAHKFQSVGTKAFPSPTDVISGVVIELWSERIFLNHWGCLGAPAQHEPGSETPTELVVNACRKVWLPPYQFTKSKHWVPYVDRVREAQQNQVHRQPASGDPLLESAPRPLVSKRELSKTAAGVSEFIVNTSHPRYRSIVKGHVVCSRPLCPAALYMECATMATILLLGDHKGTQERTLTFDNLLCRSPLSLDPQKDVIVRLRETHGVKQAWAMTIISTESLTSEVCHVEGIISYGEDTGIFEDFQRLVTAQMQGLVASAETESLLRDRVYKLFQRVVDYDACLQGIKHVQLGSHQAVATVEVPREQPHRHDQATAWRVCDAVAMDTAIQVVGLLVNTSEAMSSQDIAVMGGIRRTIVSPAFSASVGSTWTVYATFSCTQDPQQPVGDVFVCSSEGQLIAIFTGCRMTKLPVSKLEKIFDKAFSTGKNPPAASHRAEFQSRSLKPLPNSSEASNTSGPTQAALATPQTSVSAAEALDQERAVGNTAALRNLVAECTGIEPSDIPHNSSLGLMGLDSLGSAELAEELNTKFGLSISSLDLLDRTLDQLQQQLGLQPLSQNPIHHRAEPSTSGPPPVVSGADERCVVLLKILEEVTGASAEDIDVTSTLMELGTDSLSMIDLKQEIEGAFSSRLDLNMEDTVHTIMQQLGISGSTGKVPTSAARGPPLASMEPPKPSAIQVNPFHALNDLASEFDAAASLHGVSQYWTEIAPLQDEITLAYIVEGFAALGVDLRALVPGAAVPPVPYLTPKYDKLMRRLWEFLSKRDVVRLHESQGGRSTAIPITRGNRQIDSRCASVLLQEFDARFPLYRNETDLIGLTGPRLADCLSGRIDSVALMFGNARSLQIMEQYYAHSPVSLTLSEQLSRYLDVIWKQRSTHGGPIRILEAGGGTGGTTRWVAAALSKACIPCEYTFTDISSTLVKKAKTKFAPQYPWMVFTTFNLDEDVRPELRGQFDIVIATNTVHATIDRVSSCRRMLETLLPTGGLLILAELTCHIDWFDICFGLLDGWWFADGPIAPLQTAESWMRTLSEAGFASMGYSRGREADANIAQLVVGCNMPWDTSAAPLSATLADGRSPKPSMGESRKGDCRVKTVVYKEVDGVQIQADVYVPTQLPTTPMPIALMIHGGGYVTLSRRAVRPAQTRHLLRLGFLPVSIDYRLCPEVNLIEGPMTDVCDALRWARATLPGIMFSTTNLLVDGGRVVAVGWSTGGHLAMSLGWTAMEAGIQPPSAVLSFYAPTDFESGELDEQRYTWLPEPAKQLRDILTALPTKPITNSSSAGDTQDLGWVLAGDPHSDLLLSMSQQGITLPVLINGLAKFREHGELDALLVKPPPSVVASVSPLARARAGQYAVPTFIAHGTKDEIAPFAAAELFVAAVHSKTPAVACELLAVPGARHSFDLKLEEGSPEWDRSVAPGYDFLCKAICFDQ